jgi:hypothetical protein
MLELSFLCALVSASVAAVGLAVGTERPLRGSRCVAIGFVIFLNLALLWPLILCPALTLLLQR